MAPDQPALKQAEAGCPPSTATWMLADCLTPTVKILGDDKGAGTRNPAVPFGSDSAEERPACQGYRADYGIVERHTGIS